MSLFFQATASAQATTRGTRGPKAFEDFFALKFMFVSGKRKHKLVAEIRDLLECLSIENRMSKTLTSIETAIRARGGRRSREALRQHPNRGMKRRVDLLSITEQIRKQIWLSLDL